MSGPDSCHCQRCWRKRAGFRNSSCSKRCGTWCKQSLITTTQHYGDWLAERWGISSRSRHNTSDHWLSLDDLDDTILTDLSDRTSQDQKVFDVVSWLLSRTGRPAVTGAEIAEAVGARSFE